MCRVWGYCTECRFTRNFVSLEKIKNRQGEVESLLTAEVKTTDGPGEDEEEAKMTEEPGVGEGVVQMDQGGGRRGEQANSDSGEGSD